MIKIALIQFTSNLAVSISWWKRQDFKKWHKVVVWVDDVKMLLRLWCVLLNEKTLDYKTDKKVLDSLFKIVETPKVETLPELPKVELPKTEDVITDDTAPQKVEETKTETKDEDTTEVKTEDVITDQVKVEETTTEDTKGA